MRRATLLVPFLSALWVPSLAARETVEASPPIALAVTLYRDPYRDEDAEMDPDWPEGFAMITETRTVTLPPGESRVRFGGVAEGMIAVSAIVTGLPGGTIEKNRNAELLGPASLLDGTLGNRVTVTRTNPATGAPVAEQAIVRTRADGGLVLQTGAGFEAVRCAGIPEKLTFERVPVGLSAQPVFSVDTRDPAGGMYTVGLTYLAWGFDWQAHYVATLEEPGRDDQVKLRLMSWLTLLNDNGQGFPNAELLVVAGRLNVVSDFEGLADPPDARPLSLTWYPLGSTAAGSPIDQFHSAPPRTTITVRHSDVIMDSISESLGRVPGVAIGRFADAKKAEEEALGDLKLYRVPERVNVAAKSLKQVVFLDQDAVEGRLLYKSACSPWDAQDEALPAAMLLATVNDRSHGLGMALPMGGVTVFEPSSFGDQLVAEERLRDYAEGRDVEIALGMSSQVFARCERTGPEFSDENPTRWSAMRATLSNANRNPARVRLVLGPAGEWQLRGLSGTRVKDGEVILEVTVPGNGRREVSWELRPVGPI